MDRWMVGIGFLGQALFMGRVLWQWLASERAGRPVIPKGYWHLSLLGSLLVLGYAVSVHNLVFVLSLVPGAVVSARNLRIRRRARRRELAPWAAALAMLIFWTVLAQPRVGPPVWAAVGLAGSLLWGLRHLAQWWRSERLGLSTLPFSFWALSFLGSLLLLAYAASRRDPVMVVGYAFGTVPYLRNLRLLKKAHAAGQSEPDPAAAEGGGS